jgi:23S rRNA (uracil1939-C5)-methyltransferase
MLRHSVARDQWMVNIVTAEKDLKILEPLAQILTSRYPRVVTVVNNVTSRPAGVAIGESEYVLAGAGAIVDTIGGCEFEISANSFFQTNTRAAAVLYETVAQYAGLSGSETVLDLYSGTGTIPILLAGFCKQLIGVEIVGSAVADALANCRRNNVSNCRFVQGDLRTCLDQFDHRPDVLIIDPPRTGMHPDTVRQVLKLGAGRMVYVSCNPATLARDLDLMRESYRPLEIQPVDMFPHTYHIEAVVKLKKINT